MKDLEKNLLRPFDEDDIQWRVQRAGISAAGHPYVIVIPYVSNRAIQKRLDEVFGVLGWENLYKPTPDGKGFLCGITVHENNKSITKWDGAEYTNIEPLKGALSDSMKRSAVQFGIGRYLYHLEPVFAECWLVDNQKDASNLHIHYPNKQNKQVRQYISWSYPTLPSWALPFEDYSIFLKDINTAKDMEALRLAFETAYKASQSSQSDALMNEAVKAKDKRKADITKHIKEHNQKLFNEIKDWLLSEVSAFYELPSQATVENFKKVISENLRNRTVNLPFDTSSLELLLNNECQNRLNQLNQ